MQVRGTVVSFVAVEVNLLGSTRCQRAMPPPQVRRQGFGAVLNLMGTTGVRARRLLALAAWTETKPIEFQRNEGTHNTIFMHHVCKEPADALSRLFVGDVNKVSTGCHHPQDTMDRCYNGL